MRRVVAEQIKALNELTEIVTRSSRAVDSRRPWTSRAERCGASCPRSDGRRPPQAAGAGAEAALPSLVCDA